MSSTSGVDGDLGVERKRQQRQLRAEVRHESVDERGRLRAGFLRESSGRIPTSGRNIARSGANGVDAAYGSHRHFEHLETGIGGGELLDEAGLAGAGLGNELDGGAVGGVPRPPPPAVRPSRSRGRRAAGACWPPRPPPRRSRRRSSRSRASPCPSSGTAATSARSACDSAGARRRWQGSHPSRRARAGSPITAYVRLMGGEIGPARTGPRLTPTGMAGPTPASTTARSAGPSAPPRHPRSRGRRRRDRACRRRRRRCPSSSHMTGHSSVSAETASASWERDSVGLVDALDGARACQST